MKNDPRRLAPLGLVLSLLAVLAFVGFLLVRGLSAVGIVPLADGKILERGLYISGAAIILGFALTAILDPERTRRFLVGRQAQYGSNSIIMFLAFTGILIFANVLAYQNPKTWDLTEDQKNTLAPETLNIITALPESVSAKAYYSSRLGTDEPRKLLEKFKENSKGKFAFEFIDPELNPVAAQEDGIERDGTIILKMGSLREPVSFASEQEIDVALLRLINPENRVVYFTTGHGEPSIDTAAENTYTLIKGSLEKKNYTVKVLNLQSEGKIPEDAKVVVLGGLQVPMTAEEVQALETYLSNGGSVIVMVDPLALTKFGDAADPLADLLMKWGITLNNDLVIDPNANPTFVAIADPLAYAKHPITESLLGLNTLFPTARSLKLEATADGLSPQPLAVTSPNAWGETDIESINQNRAVYDDGVDNLGPVTLVASVENLTTRARLVVFGDSEFPADALYQRGNGDILVNAVDWAAEQEGLINLAPKETDQRTFSAPGPLGLIGMILTSLCLIPLLVIAGGIAAWYSRRRRG